MRKRRQTRVGRHAQPLEVRWLLHFQVAGIEGLHIASDVHSERWLSSHAERTESELYEQMRSAAAREAELLLQEQAPTGSRFKRTARSSPAC